ncbi:MAG: coproporphyrinogen-III oxidase family protein [bacterium]
MKNNNLSIYIHVPFCKSKCNYCNFYSINSENINNIKFKNIDDIDSIYNIYLQSLIKELKIMAEEYNLHSRVIKTIYFGGGTPSVMDIGFFEKMINNIYKTFTVSDNAEITAEVNPESAGYDKLKSLRSLGINRLSVGAQSFNDNVLKFAGRIHSSIDILHCVDNARKNNFNNISLDLVLGLPGQTANVLQNDINYLTEIKPEHISAYIISIEKGSKFYKNFKKLNLSPEENYEFNKEASNEHHNYYVYDSEDKYNENYKYYKDNEDYEDKLADLYITAAEEFKKHGYNHYEISNFALNGFESRHNINYWERGEYIGLGPSASSFLKLNLKLSKDNNNKYNKNGDDNNNSNNKKNDGSNNNNNNKNESNDDNNVNNLEIRITNEANIIKYIDKILNFEKNILQLEDKKYKFKKFKTDEEILTKNNIINEEIFLSLRTNKGISLENIYKYVDKEIINNLVKAGFAEIYIKDMCSENSIKNAINAKNIKNLTKIINIDDDDDAGADNNISKFNSISNNYINNHIRLTLKGMLISSEIFSKILV